MTSAIYLLVVVFAVLIPASVYIAYHLHQIGLEMVRSKEEFEEELRKSNGEGY